MSDLQGTVPGDWTLTLCQHHSIFLLKIQRYTERHRLAGGMENLPRRYRLP